MTEYTEANRPQNQKSVDGVILDPNLRDGFDDTANDERDETESSDWWGVPYIVTSGDYFMVRRLDGGAWDRSTMKGSYETIEEAISAAKQLTA